MKTDKFAGMPQPTRTSVVVELQDMVICQGPLPLQLSIKDVCKGKEIGVIKCRHLHPTCIYKFDTVIRSSYYAQIIWHWSGVGNAKCGQRKVGVPSRSFFFKVFYEREQFCTKQQ